MRTSRRMSHAWFLEQFEDLVQANKLRVNALGMSEEGRPLFAYQWGSGSCKWMAWSQMHGDEYSSTHTLLRWVQELSNLPEEKALILESRFSFLVIPVVNPDGLERATRENAKGIDLNRDFNTLEAVESRILRNQIDLFKPHLSFNMHDQRSIFSVGVKSAAGSILVPFSSSAKHRNEAWTVAATNAGKLVNSLENLDQSLAVGKYTDDYYPEAFGDNLMALGFPNILVECGFAKDVNRMDVVQWWAAALTQLMIDSVRSKHNFVQSYDGVPFMVKRYADIACTNTSGDVFAAFILVPSEASDVHLWKLQNVELDVFDEPVQGRITWKYRDEAHFMDSFPADSPSTQRNKTAMIDPAGKKWTADQVASLISQNLLH